MDDLIEKLHGAGAMLCFAGFGLGLPGLLFYPNSSGTIIAITSGVVGIVIYVFASWIDK